MSTGASSNQKEIPVRSASRRIRELPRSAIREIMALAAGQSDVIHLEVGEPDFGTPRSIIEKSYEDVLGGATRYTSNAGVPRLRELIAERASARAGVPISASEVVVTTGAIGALFTAIFLTSDPGDEVLVPDPGWPNYASICHLAGVKAVRYNLRADSGFLPDLAEIRSLITPRTKAILINTPGNPSGTVIPLAVMEQLGDLVRETGIYLLSDEIYEDIIYEGQHVSAASVAPRDRIMLISGVSKTYAMTGWRIGYLVAPADLIESAAGLQEPITSCPSAPSQMAAIAALSGDQDVVSEFLSIFKRRRSILESNFADDKDLLPIVPNGAFYALIDISSTGKGSLEFAKDLLVKRQVAVVPGVTFGPSCDRFVRVAFTTGDEALQEGLVRLIHTIRSASN